MSLTDRQKEAYETYKDLGSYTEGAKALSISRSTFTSLVRKAEAFYNASSGQVEAMEASGLDIGNARHGWRIIQHDDGSKDSVFWKSEFDHNKDPNQVVESVKDAFSEISAAVPLPMPPDLDKQRIAVFPVADLHIGLLTDEEEVGVDWDTKKALEVFEKTFGKLVANTPDCDTAILAQLGDLTHNDDQNNVTPQSKHQLDVDSRYFLIVRRAVAAMKWAIDALRQKYTKVIYRGCRGNHDMTTHIAVTMALKEHYRNVPSVVIEDSASEFYAFQFGQNMFFFHHGDKAKPEKLVPFIANEYAEMWGNTKHRVVFSGHVHHEWTKEYAGILFRSMGTLIPRDVHSFSHAYGSNRCLQSLTYDKENGEVTTARVNI